MSYISLSPSLPHSLSISSSLSLPLSLPLSLSLSPLSSLLHSLSLPPPLSPGVCRRCLLCWRRMTVYSRSCSLRRQTSTCRAEHSWRSSAGLVLYTPPLKHVSLSPPMLFCHYPACTLYIVHICVHCRWTVACV